MKNAYSGAGTYLKWGHTSGAKRRKNVFRRAPPLLCFVERFHDGQCSLVSFLLAVILFTVPPCHTKSAPLKYLLN